VKGELRALNPGNQKRKWNDRGISSESVAQKKPTVVPNKSSQRHRRSLVLNVNGQTIQQLSAM